MPKPNNVTGRDGYLLCQALCLAVAIEPYLPQINRSPTNCEDMQRLLDARFPEVKDYYQIVAAEVVAQIFEGTDASAGAPQ
jgi:hypothetical protein